MGEAAALEKDGVERDLQLLLADDPTHIEPGLRLVKREWPTDVGPVDLMCRDEDDGWVAVEIKRVGTIDAVEQLSRYLDCIRADPARAACRGILAAQSDQAAGGRARREPRHRLRRGRPRRPARRARARADALRVLGPVERDEPLAPRRRPRAAHFAGSGANGSTSSFHRRLRSTRHAPATKPSTVNVCFVVAFFVLKTASRYSGGTMRLAVAVREDDRVERGQEAHRRRHVRGGERRARHVVERPSLLVGERPQPVERRVDLPELEARELRDVVARRRPVAAR